MNSIPVNWLARAFLGVLAALSLIGCSADWPAFRHNILRTGAQLNSSSLSDPAKVPTLHQIWSFPVTGPAVGGFRASPVIYKGVIYVGSGDGHMYAINEVDGSLKWQYPAAAQPALTSTFTCNPSSFGIASSAMITKINGTDAVVFGAPDRSIGAGLGSGRLFALNANNGAVIWISPEIAILNASNHQQIGYSSPLVYNDRIYIGVADHCDDPIQRGKLVVVSPSTGMIDPGFAFISTGPPSGGGIWGSAAAWDGGVYTTTGNVKIGANPEPVPNNGLSLLRLDESTGAITWKHQPVPFSLDGDPDWSTTPTVMLASCGTLVVSTQKDGWTWAVNAGDGTPGPANVAWAFPPGPWTHSGFNPGDGTVHGDTPYVIPGAAWKDVYIARSGGLDVTTDVWDGFKHLYAFNVCTSDSERVRWIKDVPSSSPNEGSLGPPTVHNGVVYIGTDGGHLVALVDPSVMATAVFRCSNPAVPNASCVANGFALVPDPVVLADLNLNAGAIHTEPALVGNSVFVSTDGGRVFRLDVNP